VTAATEIWSYRNLIYNLAQRELRSRYKKSLLGWLWSLINPAAMLLIYSMVFGVILRIAPPVAGNGDLQSYGLYLFAGLLVWNFFSGTVNGAISALQGAGELLNKVYFPASAPAIANTMTVLLQALIEGCIFAAVMIALGNAGITFVMFPVILVFVGLFGLGLGLFLSVFNVFYRDVGYLVGIGMQVLFYATPIIYPVTEVPERAWGLPIGQIVRFNPLTKFVYWSRDAFYSLQWPSLSSVLGAAGAAIITFAVGWMVFNIKARNIAEEL
jgi:ABC-type polysaccharide/polyol phosphate export permease